MGTILNNSLLGPLAKASSVRTYERGQTIVYPDNGNSHMYLIKNGTVVMENINQSGEKKVLYIFGPTTLFPMVSFQEGGAASAWFYTALTDTEVYVIPYDELKERLKATDGFTAYNLLLRQILREVHELLLHISDHAKTDSTEKIISICLFLLEYHTKKTSNVWRLVSFPVTHQLLADMTGLARETVSLTLKELAGKKLIRYQEKGRLELNVKNFSKEQHS